MIASSITQKLKSLGDKSKPLNIIDSDPKIGQFLIHRKPVVVPERIYNWASNWVVDIGGIIRSKGFIASNLAYGIVGAGKGLVFGQQKRSKK